MHSKNADNVIAELDKFLKFKHPSSVLQFITGMMVGWTHFDRENKPDHSDIDRAWDQYFKALRSSIDRRLLSPSDLGTGRRKRVFCLPAHVYQGKKLNQVIALLGSMPADDAINFMAEVTTNWCFSIPENYLPLLPDGPAEKTDEAIANAIYTWLVRYYDLWP
ncbi:MAG: hypothetical protein IPL71_03395 [Anaerolineales bacterium]|uniref:hypothetical protein n=1 Tax=Candidatus Villigracilis proximus TaxID=3140683 RepID=UPI0031375795|nr:hypothetical protein [Anaerolineales bacterium]